MKTYVWIIILICLAGIAGTFIYLYTKAKKNCGCNGGGKNVGTTKTDTGINQAEQAGTSEFGRYSNPKVCTKWDNTGKCIAWTEGKDKFVI